MLNHSWALFRSACHLLHGARVTVLEPKNSMADSKIWIQSSPFAQCNLELGYTGKLAYFSAGMMQLRVRLSDELTCFSSDMMRPSALSRAWYSSSFSMSSVPAFPALASCSCQPGHDNTTQSCEAEARCWSTSKHRSSTSVPCEMPAMCRLSQSCLRCYCSSFILNTPWNVMTWFVSCGLRWGKQGKINS